MNDNTVVSPLAASKRWGAGFHSAYPMRKWTLVKSMKQMMRDNVRGMLCSPRFTWQRLGGDEFNAGYLKKNKPRVKSL